MLYFGLAISKVCITYSRCPCNKLWRHLECLYHELYKHAWHQRARQFCTKRKTIKYITTTYIPLDEKGLKTKS